MPDWWTLSGWWFGALGLVMGVAGWLWGVWARSHPARARLVTRISEYPISFPDDPRIRVSFDGVPLQRPLLVSIEVEHAGGEEIETTLPEAIRFTSAPDAPGRIVGLLAEASSNGEVDDGGTVSLNPRIFKVGEKASLSLMADGRPELVARVRIARVLHLHAGDVARRIGRRQTVLSVIVFAMMVSGFGLVAIGLTYDRFDALSVGIIFWMTAVWLPFRWRH